MKTTHYHDSIDKANCFDVAHFRMLLKRDRRADDNLKHKLNTINTGNYDDCAMVAKWLSEMHAARRAAINRCIKELASEHSNADNTLVYNKEIVLLNGELVVEGIVEEQSWSIFKEQCRVLGDIEKYKDKK